MINLKSISPYSETKSTQGFIALRLRSGFTIVELLVVIVVIGILASITVVSYTGVSQKATAVSLQSDLANAKKQLEVYRVLHESYPTTLDINQCPTAPVADTTLCLKSSGNNSYTQYMSDGTTFTLGSASGSTKYTISDTQSPQLKLSLAVTDPTNWITIGNQVWAKKNVNEGTMINGTLNQTNNGGTNTVEKYCYNNDTNNCTTYGGLYQWNEAMNYSTIPGSRGICPTGSHIPTDDDWKVLEMQLGMTQAQADATGSRGTDQGTKLKATSSLDLAIPLAGYRAINSVFYDLSSTSFLWTSSESGVSVWSRHLGAVDTTGYRLIDAKNNGFSVRCLEN